MLFSLLSITAAVLLMLPVSIGSVLFSLAALGLGICFLDRKRLSFRLHPFSLTVWGIVIVRFAVLCFLDPLRVQLPALVGRLYPIVLPIGAAAVLGICAYPAVNALCGQILDFCRRHPLSQTTVQESDLSLRRLLLLLAAAGTVVTLFSKNSPLYPFNDWVDAQCFYTMGNALLHGKVLYRNIYEQKGPLLYMLYAVSCLGKNPFIGIWLLEIAGCWWFLVNSYRSMSLYSDSHNTMWVMPILAFAVYSTSHFSHGGSCEELCLAALSYCGWLGLRILKTGKLPRWWACLLIGISSGCVLWIKFNLLGFYVGWILAIAPILLKRGQGKSLFSMIGLIALGVCAVSAPIMLFFLRCNSLTDMLTAYFYNNIFVYRTTASRSSLFQLVKGIFIVLRPWHYLPLLTLGLPAALCMIGKGHREELVYFGLTFGIAYCAIFFSAPIYDYYAFILNVSLFFCFLPLTMLFPNANPRQLYAVGAVCILLGAGSPNPAFMGTKKADLPQYQFAQIIHQTPNATLLNYGFLDGGFYMAADIIPTTRFFCTLHVPLEEMNEELDRTVQEGLVDYIVTRSRELESHCYRQIAQVDYRFEDTSFTFRLYHRVQ